MRILSIAGSVILLILLGACQGGGSTVREAYGVQRFLNLEGGQLRLLQPLQVAAGKARVFMQDGKAGVATDDYSPQCSFEIESVDHQGFTVSPDTFLIERVQGLTTEVVLLKPVKVAARQLALGMDGFGLSQRFEGYHFWLSSAQQPQVMRMTCYGAFASPGPDLQPPTLAEIREVLGPIAELSY